MELVGVCVKCRSEVFCRDGFLDGIVDHGNLFCHDCFQHLKQSTPDMNQSVIPADPSQPGNQSSES